MRAERSNDNQLFAAGEIEEALLEASEPDTHPAQPESADQSQHQQPEQPDTIQQPLIQPVRSAFGEQKAAEQRSADLEPDAGRPRSGRPKSGRRASQHAAVESQPSQQQLQQPPDGHQPEDSAQQPLEQPDEKLAQQLPEEPAHRALEQSGEKIAAVEAAPEQPSEKLTKKVESHQAMNLFTQPLYSCGCLALGNMLCGFFEDF